MSFRKGDKVYSLTYGWGVVTHDIKSSSLGRLWAEFHSGRESVSYDENGAQICVNDQATPDLYHGIPKIIAPPEPKRLPLECWVVKPNPIHLDSYRLYKSLADAIFCQHAGDVIHHMREVLPEKNDEG